MQIVEEFSDLLGESLVSRIENSLEIAAVGSMRRNGSYPEGDNLTPAYSNPAIMRAWYVSWIGQRRRNQVCDPARVELQALNDLVKYLDIYRLRQ